MYQKLSDPAIQIVEYLNESDILIEEKIRKYIPKYMGPNTIWGKWIPFTSVKSTISLSNIDCVHMKMNPDLPKLKLRSTKYPTNTGKIFNAKNVTLKEEKPVKLAVGKKSLELFFETKSVKILNTQVKAVLLRNRRQMPTAIEIYLHTGKSYLLDFYPQKSKEVMSAIKEIKLPSSTIVQTEPAPHFIKEMYLLQKWNSGELSNYEFFFVV